MKRRLLNALVFVLGALAVTTAVIVPLLLIERQDRERLREAAWRLCERQNLDRAELHHQATNPDRLRTRVPIMDCSPNLDGNPATPLPGWQQAGFLFRYRQGDIPPVPPDRPTAEGEYAP